MQGYALYVLLLVVVGQIDGVLSSVLNVLHMLLKQASAMIRTVCASTGGISAH